MSIEQSAKHRKGRVHSLCAVHVMRTQGSCIVYAGQGVDLPSVPGGQHAVVGMKAMQPVLGLLRPSHQSK